MLQDLPSHQGAVRGVAFSPDGSRLVSVDDDGRLVVWSTPAGRAAQPSGRRTSPVDGMVQLYIPGGEFLMGADSLAEVPPELRFFTPAHTVSLDAFWMDISEVTNGQYALCVAAGACPPPDPASSQTRPEYYGQPEYADHPVVNVTWFNAASYCQWAGRRLPSEAEWEKAARGTQGQRYPWGNQPSTAGHPEQDTVPVAQFPQEASPYGALNMADLVQEWVADWFAPGYPANGPTFNPPGPSQPALPGLRVVRSDAVLRDGTLDSAASPLLGFRCAEPAGGR